MRVHPDSTMCSMRWLTMSVVLALAACSSAPRNPASSTASSPESTPVTRASAAKALPALPAAGSGRGGYYKDDGPGDQPPDGLLDTPDAEPRVEPYSKAAMRPYTVFGKTYIPILDDQPFKQRGIGSWYGKKFHGQKTSSGELYDMYKMTAAHPTLPIPSYARVTNLKTGAQVIVRINDRGPFHSTRIIDLSYTAALKLGYLSSGSSELEVERLLPDDITRMAQNKAAGTGMVPVVATAPSEPVTVLSVAPQAQIVPVAVPALPAVPAAETTGSATVMTAGGFYLQLGAYAQEANARAARDRLMQSLSGTVEKMETISIDGLYRLYAGPYVSRPAAMDAAQLVHQRSNITPFVVQR